MKFKHISVKLLSFLLPAIVIAMAILTIVSANLSRASISRSNDELMENALNGEVNNIKNVLTRIGATAETEAGLISGSYDRSTRQQLEEGLQKVVGTYDRILGSGYWFEPGVYQGEAIWGPYAQRGDNGIEITYDYSNAEYDYFSQEYYTKVKQNMATIYTDPYYDETSGLIMMTCASPIKSASGAFVGCVTVDIEITDIQEITTDIKVGKEGYALLLSSDGTFIGFRNNDYVSKGVKITSANNKSLAEAGEEILAGDSGDTGYKNDSNLKVHTYWKTIDTTGWKLAINIPTKELDEPIVDLVIKLVIICVVAVIAVTLIVYFVIKGLTGKLSKITDFAKNLADGDYTVDTIKVTDVDEIGALGNSLNDMYSSSKSIIKSIASHSESINTSANMLNNATSELSNKFNLIKVNMSDINEAVMSSSAATQEVNASTEEVNSSASILSEQALRSKNMANEIMVRAKDVEERSKLAYDNAINLSKQYDESLQKSIDNAQIVESIGTLAGIISNIAEQINLLSLNASIEAARAGEQGKGFAVVASEIGKLAGDTTETVTKIQDTVEDVQKAFLKLTEDAKDILGFVNNTVTPDYEEFVKVGKQYGNDASEVDEISSQISEMSATIERTMNEVSIAINNIAESTQVTAASSSDSLRAVEDVSSVVTEVSDMSAKEGDIARQLDEVVGGFKI